MNVREKGGIRMWFSLLWEPVEEPAHWCCQASRQQLLSWVWFLFYKHFLCLSVLQMELNSSLCHPGCKSPSKYGKAKKKAPLRKWHKREKRKCFILIIESGQYWGGIEQWKLNGKCLPLSGGSAESWSWRHWLINACYRHKESCQSLLCARLAKRFPLTPVPLSMCIEKCLRSSLWQNKTKFQPKVTFSPK